MKKVIFYYFRSLFSQSACSFSVGKASKYLLDNGYSTEIRLLHTDDYAVNMRAFEGIDEYDIIVYKANYKDFNYGIELFRAIKNRYPNKTLYITGPFCVLNQDRIVEKYDFVDKVINIQTTCHISETFPTLDGGAVHKDTVIAETDRQVEATEQGTYVNLESSSGCVNRCNFCHIYLTKTPFVNKPMDVVVDEIEELHNKLGKNYFIFNDSIFYKGTVDEERILTFCDLIKKKGLKIYFYVYLALFPQIPEHLLDKLKEVGLVRVFFGIESITPELQISNKKNVSEDTANKFLNMLTSKGISYHIGFMLFYPEITLDSLKVNIKYLYDIKKLFRVGIIIEKMRIIPNSPNVDQLTFNDLYIDQAYNYHFKNADVEEAYNNVLDFFSAVDYRMFEQYLTGYNLAITILRHEGKEDKYKEYFDNYYKAVDKVNNFVYNNLLEVINSKVATAKQKKELRALQTELEFNYHYFMNTLKVEDLRVFKMIPIGKEDINL